jgi:hypothetical protein
MNSATVMGYFGQDVVERAIADYFARNGLSEQTRDDLIEMSRNDEEGFFDLVSDFVERTTAV